LEAGSGAAGFRWRTKDLVAMKRSRRYGGSVSVKHIPFLRRSSSRACTLVAQVLAGARCSSPAAPGDSGLIRSAAQRFLGESDRSWVGDRRERRLEHIRLGLYPTKLRRFEEAIDVPSSSACGANVPPRLSGGQPLHPVHAQDNRWRPHPRMRGRTNYPMNSLYTRRVVYDDRGRLR